MSTLATTPAGTAAPGRISLKEGDFPEFFREVHGWDPFPWQVSLLERVLTEGWPDTLDVPTGLGKTATLDVAVFASGLGSAHARRRVFMVVDRRIIVDQAYEHALEIQKALRDQRGLVCREVARRLEAAEEDDSAPVLDVTRMRGGVDWEWLWLERPDRHAIITGTVDQIGSRLLFRGYGVAAHARPIDAALAGTDSFVLVDEAHLSDVFMTSLRSMQALNQPKKRLFARPVVVAMSASPGIEAGTRHGITGADEQDNIASRRLNAARQLHLVEVDSGPADKPIGAATAATRMAAALTWHAQQASGPGRVTGVVVNTVPMAREVFRRLKKVKGAECMLLTGRIRPVDREYLLHEWLPRIAAGKREPSGKPLYVVATQTIEAGADIDLDALVTELPALPALIQRLGRLNRRGERDQATAIALYCSPLPPGVYGEARDATWSWLTKLAESAVHEASGELALSEGVAVSPLQLRQLTDAIGADELAVLYGERQYAPVIFAETLAAWARTSPAPVPDVPPEPYLHGVDQGQPAVSVCWRGDMGADSTEEWGRTTDRARPSADEAIELPIAAVRAWLAGQRPAKLADTGAQVIAAVGEEDDGGPAAGKEQQRRQVLRYRPSGAQVIAAGQIRPGDMLVVPARWGGCDRYGWDPESVAPVHDVADLCGGTRRRGSLVRADGQIANALAICAPGLKEPVEDLMTRISEDAEAEALDLASYRETIRALTAMISENDEDLPHARVLRQLGAGARLTVLSDGGGIVLTARGRIAVTGDDHSPGGSSVSPVLWPLGLTVHQDEVAARALLFATHLGLPPAVAGSCTIAALWHDEGKRDPRFQVMLHRGDRLAARAAAELLAKSGIDPADRAALRQAARAARWPSLPHEDLSGRIAAAWLGAGLAGAALEELRARTGTDAGCGEIDEDLVVHLVQSHHGRARPLLDAIDDPEPVVVEVPVPGRAAAQFRSDDLVDWEGPGRFARLCARYGYWGLAALEAIVRQADIWCSARPEDEHEELGETTS
jgi:CRISPR-associated endonuclease/helicase Cas3